MARGLLDYFPNALAYVAHVSKVGNDQHNAGQEMHWAYGKSNDHPDCIVRHLVDRGTDDKDGLKHSGKVAWRALALLEEELINEGATPGKAVKTAAPAQPKRLVCRGCGTETVWSDYEAHELEAIARGERNGYRYHEVMCDTAQCYAGMELK
jgi:hypothetical protein